MDPNKIGEHYLIELIGCEPQIIASAEAVQPVILEAAQNGKATTLDHAFHQFNPFGMSGVLLLAESHISIHTWPERGVACVDVFTCGDTMEPMEIVRTLKERLKATEVQVRQVDRTHESANEYLVGYG